ncbi:hypothetical protein KEM56_003638 [Ascosphaera pollenicola]|nr:hypothetical protein KEM56_003638 [Ascosphaera pollenicola]
MGLQHENSEKPHFKAAATDISEDDHPSVTDMNTGKLRYPLDRITSSGKSLWDNLSNLFNKKGEIGANVIWQREVHRLRRGTLFSRVYRAIDRPRSSRFTNSMPVIEIEKPTPIEDLVSQTAHAMDTNIELPNPQPMEKFFAAPDPVDLPPIPVFTHSFLIPSPATAAAASSSKPPLSSPSDNCQIHTYVYAAPLDPYAARPLLSIAFVGALFLCAYFTVQLVHSCFCTERIRLIGAEAPITVAPYQVPTSGYPAGMPTCDEFYADDQDDDGIVIVDDDGFSALGQAEEGRIHRDPSPRAPGEKMYQP